MSDSVSLLVESADRCMDEEDAELSDWDHVSAYILSPWYLNCLGSSMRVPLAGYLAHQYLYDHFSTVYDILICFIEAHDETKKLI